VRVFPTGHRGYIGAHLVGLLKEAGHYVVGCDLDSFAGCAWEPVHGFSARDFDGDQFVRLRACVTVSTG
jgi:nucleoside-diphosphate-sugar epimerase